MIERFLRWIDPQRPHQPIDLLRVGMAFTLMAAPPVAVAALVWGVVR